MSQSSYLPVNLPTRSRATSEPASMAPQHSEPAAIGISVDRKVDRKAGIGALPCYGLHYKL